MCSFGQINQKEDTGSTRLVNIDFNATSMQQTEVDERRSYRELNSDSRITGFRVRSANHYTKRPRLIYLIFMINIFKKTKYRIIICLIIYIAKKESIKM